MSTLTMSMSDHLSVSDSKAPMSVAQKRVAIAAGLRPYLQEDYLRDVMEYWEVHYSQQPAFALQRFLNDICNTALLRSQRSHMLQSVIQSLSRPPEDRISDVAVVEPVPAAAAQDATVLLDSVQSLHDEQQAQQVACFEALMDALLARVSVPDAEQLRLYLLEHVDRVGLPQTHIRAMRGWLTGQHHLPTLAFEQKHLQKLVNLLYVGLCEYLGPTKADRALAAAVNQVEAQQPDWPIRCLL